MKKTELQKHYDFINTKFSLYKSLDDYGSHRTIQEQIENYIQKDNELIDYIIAKSGAGNPEYYLNEITSEITWLEKFMPRILNNMYKDIKSTKEVE